MGTSIGRERIRWPAVVDRARQIVEGYAGGVELGLDIRASHWEG